MEELQILRIINEKVCVITLSEDELEQAYRIKERRYLDEDFVNTMIQDPDCRFHSNHLEEFPELINWLHECFDNFYDANISHNDLLKLTINHLGHACMTPEFFTELACLAPAFCEGIEKQVFSCEHDCSKYYHCSNIALADDRSKRWEELSSLVHMHKYGSCTCSKNKKIQCEAAKFLHSEWDISDFFHLGERKEAA